MSAAAEAIIGCLVALNSLPPAVIVIWSRHLRELSMYQLVASMAVGETLTGVISVVLGLPEAAPGPHLRLGLRHRHSPSLFSGRQHCHHLLLHQSGALRHRHPRPEVL